MVLAQSHSILADDGSPLALLRQRRAEADAQLPRSLVTSSLLALTFVVAVMMGQVAFRGDARTWREIPIPPIEWPSHEATEVDPVPGGSVPPSAVVDTRGIIKPVEELPPEDVKDVIAPTRSIVQPGGGIADPTGGPVSGTGSGETTAPVEPKWGDFVYYEEAPDLVTPVSPAYPAIAMQAGLEGSVSVRMLVGTDGRVKRAEIDKSSVMFNDAALAAARQWIFTPAKSNGHPVAVWVLLPVEFKLR